MLVVVMVMMVTAVVVVMVAAVVPLNSAVGVVMVVMVVVVCHKDMSFFYVPKNMLQRYGKHSFRPRLSMEKVKTLQLGCN